MKKTLFLILLCISTSLFSQNLKGHTITGEVVDSKTNQPLAGATVLVIAEKDSHSVNGTIADANGKFNILITTNEEIDIKLSTLGYNEVIIDSLDSKEKKINLGTIKMSGSALSTDEVVIKGQKPMIEYYVDKQVINMDKVPGSSGSVTEALKNTGIVEVDQTTNKITIRGGNQVNVLIDGKPMPMAENMLSQMPASYVDKVEVMTNPSAKEDAEGEVGILNIITKKNTFDNYNGSINATTSTQNMNYLNIMMNYKVDEFNFYSNISGGFGGRDMKFENNKTNYFSNSLHQLNSSASNDMDGYLGYFKLGMDYDPDTINSFSVTGSFYRFKYDFDNINKNLTYNIANQQTSSYNTNNIGKNRYDSYTLTAYYKNKINSKGTEFTTDVFFSNLDYINSDDMLNRYDVLFDYPYKQNSSTEMKTKTFIGKADYINYIDGWGKLEAGYRFTLRDRKNDYNVWNFSYFTNQWSDSLNYSNLFNYKEAINAGYLTYTNNIWILEYKAGLRAEHTYTKGEQIATNEVFDNKYLSFFPSFSLSYKINDQMQIAFNVARRINRPQMEYINPFTKFNGPNDLSRGNPYLSPTYVNLYEFGFNPVLKFYHTNSQGRPSDVTITENDSITVKTMFNVSRTRTYGIEIMLPLINQPQFPITLPDWLNMANISFTYYQVKEDRNYLNDIYALTRNAWRINGYASIKFFFDIDAMVNFRYNPKLKDERFISYSTTKLDFGLTKYFMERQLQVSLYFTDLLNSNETRRETFYPNYYSNNIMEFQKSRSIFLSVTFNFNNFKQKKDRNVDDGRDKVEGGLF